MLTLVQTYSKPLLKVIKRGATTYNTTKVSINPKINTKQNLKKYFETYHFLKNAHQTVLISVITRYFVINVIVLYIKKTKMLMIVCDFLD